MSRNDLPGPPRPDLRPEWSLAEKLLQPLCAALVLCDFAALAAMWGRLPARVPTHFGASGAADAWGGKGSLLLLPLVMLGLYGLLTAAERFPKIFNYPFDITEQNAPALYQIAREMLVVSKLCVVLIFSYLQWQSVSVAAGASAGLGAWFLPAVLVLLFGSMGFYIARMARHKNG